MKTTYIISAALFLASACGTDTTGARSRETVSEKASVTAPAAPWSLSASNPRVVGPSWSYTTPQGSTATYTAEPDAYGPTTLCIVDVTLTDTSGADAATNGYTLAGSAAGSMILADTRDAGVSAAREHVAEDFTAGETSTGVVVFVIPTSQTALCATGSYVTTSAVGSQIFVTAQVK